MNNSMLTSIELDDVEITYNWESADPSVGMFHDLLEIEEMTIPGANKGDPRIDILHMIDLCSKRS